MPRPKNDAQLKHLCASCWNDRYNHPGLCERPEIDAVVVSEKCWHLSPDQAIYSPQQKRWFMKCHSGRWERYHVQWAETKKKPTWDYWR